MFYSVDKLMNSMQSEDKSDNIDALPILLRHVYKNPHRILGLDESTATISIVRDAFRRQCLSFMPHFYGLGNPKITLQQLNFAYHLIRGTIKGPAQQIAATFHENPYLDFRATDILPLLHPMRSEFSSTLSCAKEYRGFRQFTVSYLSHRTIFTYYVIPQFIFTFDVHYCLRRYSIELDYNQFENLHIQLLSELLVVPEFPLYNQFDGMTMGLQLAAYIMRIHNLLANRQLFSPRLLKYFSIDFEQIQSEEEGLLLSILDTKLLPPRTVWHILDEQWLDKWRKFVLGRGPRRYYPPGKITNQWLAKQVSGGNNSSNNNQNANIKKSANISGNSSNSTAQNENNNNNNSGGGGDNKATSSLVIAKDYRAVNFNVWQFYSIVHGGGPNISRSEESIYSKPALSFLQGVIMIQTRIRMYLARILLMKLFQIQFSTRKNVKAVIYKIIRQNAQEDIQHRIRRGQLLREKNKLKKAAVLTQSVWRKKKNYVSEESLNRVRRDQEVFTRAAATSSHNSGGGRGMVDEDSMATGLVVKDVLPILRIGNTQLYLQTLEEDSSTVIPFKTRKMPGLEVALISDSQDPRNFLDDSKIVSINSHPASAMNYSDIKRKLIEANWPLKIELERPLRPSQLPSLSLDNIVLLEEPNLQYNAFKLLMNSSYGLKCIKHNSNRKNLVTNTTHFTTIRITSNDFLYLSDWDPRKTEDQLWKKISLFQIRHIAAGHQSELCLKKSKSCRPKIDVDFFLEITTDARTLIFEIPNQDKITALELDILKEENKISKSMDAQDGGGGNNNNITSMTSKTNNNEESRSFLRFTRDNTNNNNNNITSKNLAAAGGASGNGSSPNRSRSGSPTRNNNRLGITSSSKSVAGGTAVGGGNSSPARRARYTLTAALRAAASASRTDGMNQVQIRNDNIIRKVKEYKRIIEDTVIKQTYHNNNNQFFNQVTKSDDREFHAGYDEDDEDENKPIYKPAEVIQQLKRENGYGKDLQHFTNFVSLDDVYHTMKVSTIVCMFRKLVDEIRHAQTIVNDDGVVVRRVEARTALRKLE